jgi:hypothetical protein
MFSKNTHVKNKNGVPGICTGVIRKDQFNYRTNKIEDQIEVIFKQQRAFHFPNNLRIEKQSDARIWKESNYDSNMEIVMDGTTDLVNISYCSISNKIKHVQTYKAIILNNLNNKEDITSKAEYETNNHLTIGSLSLWSSNMDNLEYHSFVERPFSITLLTDRPRDNFNTCDLINNEFRRREMSMFHGSWKQIISDLVHVDYSNVDLINKILGLYASVDLAPNTFLGYYTGILVSKQEFDSNQLDGRYSCQILKAFEKRSETDLNTTTVADDEFEFAIDASNPFACYGRYANAAKVGDVHNTSIKGIPHFPADRLMALEVRTGMHILKAGTEITVHYGGDYWLGQAELCAKDDPLVTLFKELAENEEKNGP